MPLVIFISQIMIKVAQKSDQIELKYLIKIKQH